MTPYQSAVTETPDNAVSDVVDPSSSPLQQSCGLKRPLPIDDFIPDIAEALHQHGVVIVVAETGAGKTTRVPPCLAKQFAGRVACSLPMCFPTETIPGHVAHENGWVLGREVGFRTALNKNDSPDTRVLYATDGLLKRRLLNNQLDDFDVIILDELHVWNKNLEMLLGLLREALEKRPELKVALMSATLNAQEVSEFMGGAPVIKVPGRQFPIEDLAPKAGVVRATQDLLTAGGVEIFVYGKSAIRRTTSRLRHSKIQAELIPLHSDLSKAQRSRSLDVFPRPKVVISTNASEVGATIPGIISAIDTGWVRRMRMRDGVETLTIEIVSQQETTQRRGRIGRLAPGQFVDLNLAPWNSREEFPPPAMMNSSVAQEILELAACGRQIQDMKFVHNPPALQVEIDLSLLRSLGCLDERDAITDLGKTVEMLGIAPRLGRAIVEAAKRGVLDDVVTIAAIIDSRGIVDRYSDEWCKLCPDEHSSDLLAQLALFEQSEHMDEKDILEAGLNPSTLARARNTRQRLIESLQELGYTLTSSGEEEEILKSVLSGFVDCLHHSVGENKFSDGKRERTLTRDSVVKDCEWVMGIPLNLEIELTGKRIDTINLLTMVSGIDPSWAEEVGPCFIELKTRCEPGYSRVHDCVTTARHVCVGEQQVHTSRVLDPEHPEAQMVFCRWLADCMLGAVDLPRNNPELKAVVLANVATIKRAAELNRRMKHELFPCTTQDNLATWLHGRLPGIANLKGIADYSFIQLPELDATALKAALSQMPDQIEINGNTLNIRYNGGPQAVAVMSFEQTRSGLWKSLPDNGVFLPSGKRLAVEVFYSRKHFLRLDDMWELKSKLSEHLISAQFDAWPRPTAKLERTGVEGVSIVDCAQFGVHPLTEEPLLAYGVWQLSSGGRISPDGQQLRGVRRMWFREEQRAIAVRDESSQRLAALLVEREARLSRARAERQEDLKRQEIKSAARQGRVFANFGGRFDRRQSSTRFDFWVITPDGTLREPDTCAFTGKNGSRTKEGEKRWSLVGENEVAVSFACGGKIPVEQEFRVVHQPLSGQTEAQRVAAQQIHLRELAFKQAVSLDFGGTFSVDLCNYWVVEPSGSLRPPDNLVLLGKNGGTGRHGEKSWQAIHPGELALRFSSGRKSDRLGTGVFEVCCLPDTPTPAQLAAVEQIEREIGMPIGVFGLSAAAKMERENLIQEAARVLPRCPYTGKKIVWSTQLCNSLLSPHGLLLEDGPVLGELLDTRRPFEIDCHGSLAQIYQSLPASGGRFEILVFEKGLESYTAVRWVSDSATSA